MANKVFAGDFKLLFDTSGALTDATPTYAEYENTITIEDPDSKLAMREQIDTTSMGSQFADETSPGRQMQGDGIAFTCFFDPNDATHNAMVALAKAGTKTAMKIEAPIYDSTNTVPASWTFDASFELSSQPIEPTGDNSYRRYEGNLRVVSSITKVEEAAA
ncbi:MAG: hypothetical protein AAF267_16855 [Deinococcota bacterium]